MLVEDKIRPAKVEYDPDNANNNRGAAHTQFFKCLDPDAKVGDLVIVTTSTRHGMTVAKITAIGTADVPVNFEGHETWGWIVGPVPAEQHKAILETEKKIVGRVQEANTNKLKNELKAAMGLESVSFGDLDLASAGKPKLAAPESPPERPAYTEDRPTTRVSDPVKPGPRRYDVDDDIDF
jgi:hypothetical protein